MLIPMSGWKEELAKPEGRSGQRDRLSSASLTCTFSLAWRRGQRLTCVLSQDCAPGRPCLSPSWCPRPLWPDAGSAFQRVHPDPEPWGCSEVLSYRNRNKEANVLDCVRDSQCSSYLLRCPSIAQLSWQIVWGCGVILDQWSLGGNAMSCLV